MKEKIFCKACNTQTEYVIDNFSRYHLKINHPEIENLKHYYDLYLKKEGEGKCLVCGKDVPVHSFRISTGYQRFCSKKCGLHYVNSNWDVNAETRRKNNLKKYGADHPMKLKKNNDRRIKTNIEKYGTENPSQNKECQRKSKETCIERYGVDNPIKDISIKEKQLQSIRFLNSGERGEIKQKRLRVTNEINGKWIPLSEKREFDIYKRKVFNITYKKWKCQLFNGWNGLDFYSGEKLLTNEEYSRLNNISGKSVNKNPLQPTIDHKISIYYGFLNKIPAEEIAHIDNLCICSRSNNTKKSCRVRFL